MNRIISCDREQCGETIREIPAHLITTALDGTEETCPGCGAEGRIQVEADEGGVRVDFVTENYDNSPDCRCEMCPRGGPYTCIDASGWD